MLQPPNPRDIFNDMTHTEIRFAGSMLRILKVKSVSGNQLVDEDVYVRAVKTVAHGDTKTQAVRKEFMGLQRKECGRLVGLFQNFEGRWVVVIREDGRTVDCRANELEEITKEEYDFQSHPAKFMYHTDAEEIPPFEYNRDIVEGQTIELQIAADKTIRFEVRSVTHVLRQYSDSSKPIMIKLEVTVLADIENFTDFAAQCDDTFKPGREC